MGIFSRFENKMEDGLEGVAGKIFNAPISPVQISKKAEKVMRRERMVGAGKQYAPTLYTVLVNEEDDKALFGYYPTIAGETETFLAARAAAEGLTMDGQPLVRFIADSNLRRGKFDVVAELVSAPIIAQLRREEMQRYGILNSKPKAQPAAAPAPAYGAAPYAASQAAPYAAQAAPAPAPAVPDDPAPKKQPLPYVPENEIDRTIDYGEYTFNSQDFEDYEAHGPSAQLINRNSDSFDDDDDVFNSDADLSGFDVEAYNPAALDSRGLDDDYEDEIPAHTPAHAPGASFAAAPAAHAAAAHAAAPAPAPAPTPAPVPAPAPAYTPAPAPAPAVNTQVFMGGAATPTPDRAAVSARLINLAANRDIDLVGGRLILGRSRSCDIVISDINASRTHAELFCEGGSWIITDLGATNGTKVNGERITSHNLRTGDRITIGSTDLLFLEG